MLVLLITFMDNDEEKDKLTELYNEHRTFMVKCAIKLIKDPHLAEDIVHDSFVSIIKHKDKYLNLPRNDFRSLCVSIVKNKCYSHQRKQKHLTDAPFEVATSTLISEDRSTEEEAILSAEYDMLRKHIDSIDEISNQVLVLKYVHGMSYKEIGRELGLTPKHVETRISRAKEKVRKLLSSSKAERGEQNE